MRDRYRSVIGESSFRHICTRMRMLALSACAFCAIAAALHLASIAAVVRRMRRPEADDAGGETLEGISIVRPVCGLENFTEETLLSGFRLEYPDYEILFCVAQPSDPVIPLVRRLIELHPHVPARLLIGNECISAAQQRRQRMDCSLPSLDCDGRQQRADAPRLSSSPARKLAAGYGSRFIPSDWMRAQQRLGRAGMRVPQYLSGALAKFCRQRRIGLCAGQDDAVS